MEIPFIGRSEVIFLRALKETIMSPAGGPQSGAKAKTCKEKDIDHIVKNCPPTSAFDGHLPPKAIFYHRSLPLSPVKTNPINIPLKCVRKQNRNS